MEFAIYMNFYMGRHTDAGQRALAALRDDLARISTGVRHSGGMARGTKAAFALVLILMINGHLNSLTPLDGW
jgi:hypothetical protein